MRKDQQDPVMVARHLECALEHAKETRKSLDGMTRWGHPEQHHRQLRTQLLRWIKRQEEFSGTIPEKNSEE
jgi:hypothetical protein